MRVADALHIDVGGCGGALAGVGGGLTGCFVRLLRGRVAIVVGGGRSRSGGCVDVAVLGEFAAGLDGFSGEGVFWDYAGTFAVGGAVTGGYLREMVSL